MLDYTENKNDSKEFILYYIKKDNKIIVYYASGDKKEFDNTKDLEITILERMKNQVLNSNVVYDKNGKIVMGLLINNIFLYLSINSEGIISLISSMISLSLMTKIISIQFDFSDKRNDFLKNRFFLENENLFNDFDRKNELLLLDVSKKTRKIISSIPEEDLLFTINTIDKMKYKDLRQILYNINLFDVSEGIQRIK